LDLLQQPRIHALPQELMQDIATVQALAAAAAE
jgi:hypothetical protein